MSALLVGHRVKMMLGDSYRYGTVVKEFNPRECPPNTLPVKWASGGEGYYPIQYLERAENLQHLPLPYHVEYMGGVHYIYNGQQAVFAVHNKLLSQQENAANAEFVCKACNAHYQLLDACERVLGWDNTNRSLRAEERSFLREAIKLAKA